MKRRLLFASYSRHDREIVKQLCALLRISGTEVFRDEDAIRPGKKWRAVLADNLQRADCVLLFWSANAAISAAVRDEYQDAMSHKVDIAPVLLDGTPLPSSLAEYQWLDFRNVVSVSPVPNRPLPSPTGAVIGAGVMIAGPISSVVGALVGRGEPITDDLKIQISSKELSPTERTTLAKLLEQRLAHRDA
ncbi:toll/interleukin-1 receptor domain-containing protein [Nitrosomonas sp.]|uniref:toll/interleukin-1 receptor domain-containing protein n=1 Tax=Nitrosomonas sp. TaxID=42353 RepID=UPI0025F0D893|nr:toll/interleukin-1 receptor domain-containing protein [Nitrosomonas sp.]MBY0484090.1 toll/interleukin-1 receptor domain-containing protein [Nitrosomonas sp.]